MKGVVAMIFETLPVLPLCMSEKNKNKFLKLTSFIESEKLEQTLLIMLTKETDINEYVKGLAVWNTL